MLPRNIMLQPSDQFMLLNRSVQPFPDVMPDRSRLFKMAGIVRFRPFLHDVMTLGIIPGMILVPLFMKRIQRGIVNLKSKDEKWGEIFMTALFLGMISAFLGMIFADINTGIAGWIPIFVMLISAALMCICGLLVKKCGWRWLQDFALPICMLASMALSIPLTFALV